MDPRVDKLLKKEQPVQRTQEWFKARTTRITASNVATLLIRDEQTCQKYVEIYDLQDMFSYDNKCCNPYSNKQQFIIDKIKQTFQGSPATYWGQKYEPIATSIYERKNNTRVIEFGLLTHDNLPWLAASPDGITQDGVMLEIKCPFRRKISGIPPLYYYQQVQIQLEVADLDVCDFLEIEFVEVASMEEFIDDSLQDSEVEYKGLFIQIETIPDDFTKREYVYPPKELFNDTIELTKWYRNTVDDIVIERGYNIYKKYENCLTCSGLSYEKINIKIIYWKTQVVSTCRIHRDKQWFENIKKFLKEQWDDVLHKKEIYKDNINVLKIEHEDICLF